MYLTQCHYVSINDVRDTLSQASSEFLLVKYQRVQSINISRTIYEYNYILSYLVAYLKIKQLKFKNKWFTSLKIVKITCSASGRFKPQNSMHITLMITDST